MVEFDFGRLDNFVLLRNLVEMDFERLDNFVLLRNKVEIDFGRLNDFYYFLTWQKWILVDWTICITS